MTAKRSRAGASPPAAGTRKARKAVSGPGGGGQAAGPASPGPAKGAANGTSPRIPGEDVLVEDVALTEAILFNALWDGPPGDLEGTDPHWLARVGAIAFRRGDFRKAESLWARVPESSDLAGIVRGWRALAWSRALAVEPPSAHPSILEKALSLSPEDSHLRGELLCALGRTEEGLSLIEAGREDAEMVEWRALRQALWLMRAGKAREAGEMLDRRLKNIARFAEELHLAAAVAWTRSGAPRKARPHEKALRAAIPGLARALSGGAVEGSLPPASQGLARDPALAALGVWLLDRASAEKAHEGLEKGPRPALGVLPGPSMWDALGDAAEYTVIADTLTRVSRTAYAGASRALLLVHPARPGRVSLCLDPGIPAFLWPEDSADVEAVSRLLAPYRRTLFVDDPRMNDLPRSLRLYIGHGAAVPSPYTGELEALDFHTFSRVATTSPFLESHGFGSEHREDPHRAFVDRGGLDGMLALRRAAGMDPQRVPMESYRTMHSRSILTLEQHRSGFVLEARYRRGPHPEAVRAVNQRFGTSFPDDLPLDCVGVLMHFQGALTAEALVASVHPELPADEWWRIHAAGALLHGSLALDAWLSGLPEVFAEEAHAVAWRYGRLGFLLRRALRTPELRASIQTGPFQSGLIPPELQGEEDEDEEDEDEDEDEEES